MLGYTPPRADTPQSRDPPEQTHPQGADTPHWSRHQPRADTPQEQTPPRSDTPLEQTHPLEQTPPQTTPPLEQTPQPPTSPPGADPPATEHAGRYGQRAGGTHPTGMQSCLANANIYDNIIFTQKQLSTTLAEMSDLSLCGNCEKL